MPVPSDDPTKVTDITDRPNYYAGQYLLEDDFELEQQYHIDRLRRHHRLLHVAGIVQGLEVSWADSPTNTKLQVTAGTAIDADGRQIVLTKTKADIAIPTSIAENDSILFIRYESSEFSNQGVAASQPATSSSPGATPPALTPTEGKNRIKEEPVVEWGTTVPTGAIALVRVSTAKALIFGDRVYSGLRLPSPYNTPGQGLTLRYKGNGQAPKVPGQLELAELTGNLSITGSAAITGDLSVNGIVDFHPLAGDVDDDYEIFVRGVANEAGTFQPTLLKIRGNAITQESNNATNQESRLTQEPMVEGYFNTTVLHPDGTYKDSTFTTVDYIEGGKSWGRTWSNWLTWMNTSAADGDVVVLATFKGIFDCLAKIHQPESDWAFEGNQHFEDFLISINAHLLALQKGPWGVYPYSLVFVKGQNCSREALGLANSIVEIQTSYNQLTRDGRISAVGSGLQIAGNTTIAGKLSTLGKVGIGAAPGTEMLLVSGNTCILGNLSISGTTIIGSTTINLAAHGGGQLKITNDVNDNYKNGIYKYDNSIRLEAFNVQGDGTAAELLITGASGSNVPTLRLHADNTAITGSLSVTGDLTVSAIAPPTNTPLEIKGALKLFEGVAVNQFSDDSSFSSTSSDSIVPTQKAVKTYVDTRLNSLNTQLLGKLTEADTGTLITNELLIGKLRIKYDDQKDTVEIIFDKNVIMEMEFKFNESHNPHVDDPREDWSSINFPFRKVLRTKEFSVIDLGKNVISKGDGAILFKITKKDITFPYNEEYKDKYFPFND